MSDKYFDTPEKLKDYFVAQEGKVSKIDFVKRVCDLTGYKYDVVRYISSATLRALAELLVNCDNTAVFGMFKIKSSPARKGTNRGHEFNKQNNKTPEETPMYPTGQFTTFEASSQLRNLRRMRLTTKPGSIAGRKGLIIAENQTTVAKIMMFRYIFEEYFPEHANKKLPISVRREILSNYLVEHAHFLGNNQVGRVFAKAEDYEKYLNILTEFSQKNKLCMEYEPGKFIGEEFKTHDDNNTLDKNEKHIPFDNLMDMLSE